MLELIFLVTCCSSLPGPFWEAPPPFTSKILPRVRFSIIFCIFILTILWQYPSLLFNLFVIVRSFTCFARSSPSNSSEGSLFAEHKDLNSVKEDFISSRPFTQGSYYTFPTIAAISWTICATVCISNLSFCTSVKIFRAPTTTLTNDFCSVPNLTSPFLWSEDIILQSSELNWIESLYFMLTKNTCGISRSYHKAYV